MSTASRRRIEVAGAVAVAGALVLSAGWNVARDRARSEPRVIIATVADAATVSSGVDPVVTWRRGAEAVIADRLTDDLAAREAELAATVPSGMCVAIRVANLPLLRLGHVNMWKNFCKNKCYKFYNFMPKFYEEISRNNFYNSYKKIFIEGDVHFDAYGSTILAKEFLFNYKKIN